MSVSFKSESISRKSLNLKHVQALKSVYPFSFVDEWPKNLLEKLVIEMEILFG